MTSPRPGALQQADIDLVGEQFGVADEQVRRDHVISHVLAALSAMPEADDLIFFGGTALSRTYLPTLRLSEDIDLITMTARRPMAERIEAAVSRALRRTHGGIEWRPRLADVQQTEAAVVVTEGGLTVRVQLLAATGYPPWPTSKTRLIQRYGDAPPAELVTYTPQAFAASKLTAWLDRRAVRDLYDLWGLARAGSIDAEAVELFVAHGPTGAAPAAWMFTEEPSPSQWEDALAHQGRIAVGSHRALLDVRAAWLP